MPWAGCSFSFRRINQGGVDMTAVIGAHYPICSLCCAWDDCKEACFTIKLLLQIVFAPADKLQELLASARKLLG